MTGEPLRTRHLTKHYGDVVAADDVSIAARDGEILGLLGPNGAGKTTTIQMITGLVRPTRGRASILGHDVQAEPVAAREALGYLPEVVGIYGDMTGRQFLRYTGRFFDLSASEITRRVASLLDEVGLADAGRRRTRTYSKGMRQRLGLAAALFHDPEVLILDEPLTGLDPGGVLQMRQAIRTLGRDRTVLLSSHELHNVEDLCDRVVIIDDGEVLVDAPVDEVLRDDPVRVRIELRGDADAVADHAMVAAVERVRPGVVDATLADDADPAVLLRDLVGAGVPVESFARRVETLEDAFARITGVVRR